MSNHGNDLLEGTRDEKLVNDQMKIIVIEKYSPSDFCTVVGYILRFVQSQVWSEVKPTCSNYEFL